MNQIDEKEDSRGGGAGPAFLAWGSVGLGVAAWALAGSIPVGLDAAAIALGLVALRAAPPAARRVRWAARAGITIGGAKLLVIVAFSLKPVAH